MTLSALRSGIDLGISLEAHECLCTSKHTYDFSLYCLTGRELIYSIASYNKELLGTTDAYLPRFVPEGLHTPILRAGLQCHFYDLDTNLNPIFDLDKARLDAIKPSSLFILVSYFGFSVNPNPELICLLKSRNAFILEDCASHVSASPIERQNSSFSPDAQLFSFTKSLSAVPLARLDHNIAELKQYCLTNFLQSPLSNHTICPIMWAKHASSLFQLRSNQDPHRISRLLNDVSTTYEAYYKHVKLICDKPFFLSYTDISSLMTAVDWTSTSERRRHSYLTLRETFDRFSLNKYFITPYSSLESTDLPSSFPLVAKSKLVLEASLLYAQSMNIYLHQVFDKWWPDSQSASDDEIFPNASRFRYFNLLIPCDESLSVSDIGHLISFFAKIKTHLDNL